MTALPPSTQAIRPRVTIADSHPQTEMVITQSSLNLPAGTVTVVSSRTVRIPTSEDEQKFRQLANEWRKSTRYISSLSKMAMHPAYQKIIGMGSRAVPLILHEMQTRGGHWLWALHAITNEDPASEGATVSDAMDAWLEWGRSHGHLA